VPEEELSLHLLDDGLAHERGDPVLLSERVGSRRLPAARCSMRALDLLRGPVPHRPMQLPRERELRGGSSVGSGLDRGGDMSAAMRFASRRADFTRRLGGRRPGAPFRQLEGFTGVREQVDVRAPVRRAIHVGRPRRP
jgi:hypothetical protein